MSPHHLIVGSGPVGTTTALRLVDLGHRVTMLTRSGRGPVHDGITLVVGDANDVETLQRHLDGTGSLLNAANPPYHRWALDWPPLHAAMCTAAQHTGSLLVMMDNLYAHGAATTMPMREDTPLRPTGPKGSVRADMATSLLNAHHAGRMRAAIVRASDFYGPKVLTSAYGERVVPRVIAGKKVSLLGDLDVPHVISYMPDVAATLVAVITQPHAAGHTWLVPNAPAVTQRQLVDAFAQIAGTTAHVSTVPRVAITIGGLVIPLLREVKETWYQFSEPWTTDSTHTESQLGVHPTSLAEGVAATVAWWQDRTSLA